MSPVLGVVVAPHGAYELIEYYDLVDVVSIDMLSSGLNIQLVVISYL